MLAPAPALPDFIARELPFRRGLYTLRSGERLHLIDHGDPAARPVLMLHGNPTWSFLWRKVISRLPELRCVAPDLLGLGLSDRIGFEEHSIERHGAAIAELIEGLDLRGVILVGQDWGGAFGTDAARRVPDRIAGCVFANTVVTVPSHPRASWFHTFARMPLVSDLVFRGLGFPQNVLWKAQGDRRSIRGDVARAYRWPLRTWKDRGTPLALARLVPHRPDHPSLPALHLGSEWAKSFSGPMALVWGTRDPILGRALRRHERDFPQAPVTRTGAGHFLQEEVPDELAAAIKDVARRAD
ncbi:MAG TPA: alpha/beta fold hydrolase [Thermoanaerobaculia bacterium]|jgi:haloalkane dehalogenase|nr:alpha/beta fold hydrolase [Thermoanaerobaculia bacterium]